MREHMSVMCCTFYKPVIGFTKFRTKTLVLAFHPSWQSIIQITHYFPKLRLTESRIVIHPSADYRVYPLCYLLYAHMHLTIQIPTAYLSLYFQRRLLTYRRSKSSKVLPCLAIACRSWSEGIAQKVKGCMLRVTLAVLPSCAPPPITNASTLLRGSPPQNTSIATFYLCVSGLGIFAWHLMSASHVPPKSLWQGHAAYTPHTRQTAIQASSVVIPRE